MSSRLTKGDVERIAALAHLKLTDDETMLFARQLADILTYAERLQAVTTTGVTATWHPGGAHGPLREDALTCSLPTAEALANAPEPGDGLFKVPKVIG